jgi:hypothetical protein
MGILIKYCRKFKAKVALFLKPVKKTSFFYGLSHFNSSTGFITPIDRVHFVYRPGCGGIIAADEHTANDRFAY